MSTRGHDREVGRGRLAGEAQPHYDDDEDDDWGDLGGERDDLTDVPGGVRLQKVLAAAGVGSRRHCEELIGAGRVESGDDRPGRIILGAHKDRAAGLLGDVANRQGQPTRDGGGHGKRHEALAQFGVAREHRDHPERDAAHPEPLDFARLQVERTG